MNQSTTNKPNTRFASIRKRSAAHDTIACRTKPMKRITRLTFLLSVALSFAAVVLVLTARAQMAHAAHSWGVDTHLWTQYSERGTWLLYSSWILAIGGAESLLSCRNQQQRSSWTVAVLLGLFLYFSLVP